MKMKKYIKYLFATLLAAFAGVSCNEDPLSEDSVIVADKVDKNEFDLWLEDNYVNPYNILFKYRFEMNESDMNYYTVPAPYDLSVKMAHLVKYLCIDTYDEVAGVEFTRSYFPKMFFLIGEWEYKNNGTFILGTAEGGKKILLSGINYLDQYLAQGADALNHYYIKTIHHEFTHILNQTRPYPTDFALITGTGYVADSWSDAPYNANFLPRGYISAYSQHSDTEDFAEMLSIYITNSAAYWEAQMNTAGTTGRSLLNQKLDRVRSYMRDTFDIDIDELRATILRRQQDVVDGKVDLTDLTIK